MTDAFVAAQDEMVMVMKHIDKRAKEVSAKSPGILLRMSKIEGLSYDHSGCFRETCIRTCQMHNFERVLVSLFSTLMGSQGLAYDATTSQNLYRLNYYWVKFKAMVEALTTQSVGGDPDLFNEAPPEIRNLIGEIATTRWLSSERTTERLIDLLQVKATEHIIDFVKLYFGGEETDDWKTAKDYCVCIDSDDLSQFMLTFWYLANHTPGGRKGEGLVGCMKVLGFLGSPYQRVSIYIVASLYPIHLEWVKFSDRGSEIGKDVKTISTRSIENVLFERHFVESIQCLSNDWKSFLPGVQDFIISESIRAKNLGLITEESEMQEFFDIEIKKGTDPMMAITLKYFITPSLRIGWSILQVIDPHVGPAAAGAILVVLRKLGYVSSDDDTCSDEALLIPDIIGACPMWYISSKTVAAPGMTMRNYQNIIIKEYMSAHEEVAHSVIKGYALSNKLIINELKSIAKGNLKKILQENGKWPINRHLKYYWNLFKEHFPALEDSLIINFESRPITGTSAEQTFSLAGTQIRANNSASTNAKNMRHASDVKGAILRDMKDFQAAHVEGVTRIRLLRDKNSKHDYLSKIIMLARSLVERASDGGLLKLPTKRKSRGKGKKIKELKATLPHSLNEMVTNAKSKQLMAGGEALKTAIINSNNAKINGWDNMPSEIVDPLIVAARKMTVVEIKARLSEYYTDNIETKKSMKNMKKGTNDNEECLIKLVVEYWREHNIIPN